MHQNLFFRLTQLRPSDKELVNAVCMSPEGSLLVVGGDNGIVHIWDIGAQDIKQSIQVGSVILAVHWINIEERFLTFLVGAHDGSVTLYQSMSIDEPFRLAFKTFVYGSLDSMHIDYSNHTLAVVGGDCLFIWTIRVSKTISDIIFSLSEIPVPKAQVTVVNKPPNIMRLRTVHLLPQINSVLLSFVETDIASPSGHLAVFRIQPWYLTRAVDINRRIGLSALSGDRSIYAFTNLLDGIELYSSTTLAHRCSIAQAVDPHNNIALGLVIAGNRYVFSGCSGGVIWMYDQNTGKSTARLQNPISSATVQVVTACSGPQRNLIAGSLTDGSIQIWEWHQIKPRRGMFSSPRLYFLILFILVIYVIYYQRLLQ